MENYGLGLKTNGKEAVRCMAYPNEKTKIYHLVI